MTTQFVISPGHLPMSPDVKTHIHELSQRADQGLRPSRMA